MKLLIVPIMVMLLLPVASAQFSGSGINGQPASCPDCGTRFYINLAGLQTGEYEFKFLFNNTAVNNVTNMTASPQNETDVYRYIVTPEQATGSTGSAGAGDSFTFSAVQRYGIGDGKCELELGETFVNSPDDCKSEFAEVSPTGEIRPTLAGKLLILGIIGSILLLLGLNYISKRKTSQKL